MEQWTSGIEHEIDFYLEKLFEEESIKFGDLPDDDETGDRDESHVRRARVEP